jgi:hypothetical protein
MPVSSVLLSGVSIEIKRQDDSSYRRSACRFWGDNLAQWIRAGRMPEADSVRRKVYLVSNVMPDVGSEGRTPLRYATNIPPKVCVAGTAFATDQAVLHFREVAFEETDLMLIKRARGVRVRALHTEVIEDMARIDSSSGLRDQLSSSHGLSVPV